MIVAYVPILIALVGLVVYLLSANPKAQELGRLLFACGMLVTLLSMAGHALRIGS